MTKLCCLTVLAAGMLAGCNVTDDDEKSAQELNVNSRYTVESVNITGQRNVTISDPLRSELDSFVGTLYDHSALEKAGRPDQEGAARHRCGDQGHARQRAGSRDRQFRSHPSHEQDFDLNVGKFVYDSKEGWTGDGSATTNFNGNAFTFGLVSDSDSLIERYAGVRAKFERKNVWAPTGCAPLRIRRAYHEQWNPATLAAAPPGMNLSVPRRFLRRRRRW